MIHDDVKDVDLSVLRRLVRNLRSRPAGYPVFNMEHTYERVGGKLYGNVAGYILCDAMPVGVEDVTISTATLRHVMDYAGLSPRLYDSLVHPRVIENSDMPEDQVSASDAADVIENGLKNNLHFDWTPVINRWNDDDVSLKTYGDAEEISGRVERFLTVYGKST
jgi:hypothetical protein